MMHQQVEVLRSNQGIAEVAMCNEQNPKYYTDKYRPTNFRVSFWE